MAARAPATKEEKDKALGHDQDSRALQPPPLATVMPMENAALVNLTMKPVWMREKVGNPLPGSGRGGHLNMKLENKMLQACDHHQVD